MSNNNWWPDLSDVPKVLGDKLEIICKHADDITPKEGSGIRITDATGGGKVIDNTRDKSGGVVKDCFFLVNGERKIASVPIDGGLRSIPDEE